MVIRDATDVLRGIVIDLISAENAVRAMGWGCVRWYGKKWYGAISC